MTATPTGALRGVRVLDLTRYLAGPFCTMLLGDMGADVVKLEPPRGGREFGGGPAQANYFFLSVNRSKRSATLDLRDAGRARRVPADGGAGRRRGRELPPLGDARSSGSAPTRCARRIRA